MSSIQFDKIFNAILAKNQLARMIKNKDLPESITTHLQDIEQALSIAAKRLGKRDNQPSVDSILNSSLDI